MEENKDSSKYGNLTKELLDEVLNDISKSKVNKDRNFKFRVSFTDEKQAENWMNWFDGLIKEEFNKTQNESKNKSK